MSDDLHTRLMAIVSAALTDERSASRGVPIDMCVADHLIRELGLRQQWLVDGYKPFDVKPPEWNQVARTRYVTDWKADDE